MMDAIFTALFAIVPYQFFEGAMGLVVLFEFAYTFFETWDML